MGEEGRSEFLILSCCWVCRARWSVEVLDIQSQVSLCGNRYDPPLERKLPLHQSVCRLIEIRLPPRSQRQHGSEFE